MSPRFPSVRLLPDTALAQPLQIVLPRCRRRSPEERDRVVQAAPAARPMAPMSHVRAVSQTISAHRNAHPPAKRLMPAPAVRLAHLTEHLIRSEERRVGK